MACAQAPAALLALAMAGTDGCGSIIHGTAAVHPSYIRSRAGARMTSRTMVKAYMAFPLCLDVEKHFRNVIKP